MKARGKRLELLRVIAGLSEIEAAKITQVAPITYKDWEYGKHPIPVRRIRYLLDMIRLEGLTCTIEWITDGVGEGPSKIQKFEVREPQVYLRESVKPIGHQGEILQIQKELATFLQGYADAIDFTVQDDGMAPIFSPGDIVAGVKLYGKEIKKIYGTPAIVTLDNGITMLRILHKGSASEKHTLLCSNIASKEEQILHEVGLLNIAPVIWHRVKNFRISTGS